MERGQQPRALSGADSRSRRAERVGGGPGGAGCPRAGRTGPGQRRWPRSPAFHRASAPGTAGRQGSRQAVRPSSPRAVAGRRGTHRPRAARGLAAHRRLAPCQARRTAELATPRSGPRQAAARAGPSHLRAARSRRPFTGVGGRLPHRAWPMRRVHRGGRTPRTIPASATIGLEHHVREPGVPQRRQPEFRRGRVLLADAESVPGSGSWRSATTRRVPWRPARPPSAAGSRRSRWLAPRPNIMSAMTRRPPGRSHCAARATRSRLSGFARWCSA